MKRHLQLLALGACLQSSQAAIIYYEGWPGSNGQWDTASNWTPVRVPNLASDDVVINYGSFPTLGGTPANVTLSTSKTINALYVGATEVFRLNGGTLTINTTTDIAGTLRFSNGTIAGNAPLNLGGLIVDNAVTLGGTVGMAINGDVVINNPVNISQFVWTRPITSSTNVGVSWLDGNVSFTNNTLTTASSKQFLANANESWQGGSLTIRGPLNKTSTGATALYPTTFISRGGIDVSAGQLNIGGTTNTYTGVIQGNIGLFSGTHDFNEGSDVRLANFSTNIGTVRFNSGTNVNGISLNITNSSSVTVNTGVIGSFNNVSIGGQFNMCSFGGTGNPVILGSTTLLGGTLGAAGGQVTLKGPLTAPFNNTQKQFRGTVITDGPTTLNTNDGWSGSGATAPTTTWVNNGAVSVTGASSVWDLILNNQGSITKSGAGEFLIYNPSFGPNSFNNSGTMNVSGGTVRMYISGSHSGTWISSGSGQFVVDGTHTYGGGTNVQAANFLNRGRMIFGSGASLDSMQLTNEGTLEVNSGSLGSLESLTMNSGTITGTGDVAFGFPFTFSAGTYSGTGRLILSQGATFGAGTYQLNKPVTLRGTSNWPAGVTAGNSSETLIAPGATLNANGTVWGSGSWVIQGTLSKNSGAGTTAINSPFLTTPTLSNQGVIEATTGTLSMQLNANHTGQVRTSGTGVIQFRGDHSFNSGSRLGPGTFSTLDGYTAVNTGADVTGATVSVDRNGNFLSSFSVNTGAIGAMSKLILNGGIVGGSGQLTVSGPIELNEGSMSRSGKVVAQGGINAVNSSVRLSAPVELSGQSSVQGSMINLDTGTLLVNDGAILNLLQNSALQNGLLTNNGTIRYDGALFGRLGEYVNQVTRVTNNGLIRADSGQLRVTNLSNIDGLANTLSGGSYSSNGGKVELRGLTGFSGSLLNRSTLTLNSPTASIDIYDSSSLTYRPILNVITQNEGNISIFNNVQTSNVNLTNKGVLYVGSGASLQYNALTQPQGSLAVDGSLASPVTMTGGVIYGGGEVNGAASLMGGLFSPGAAIGPMSFRSSLTLGPNLVTLVEAEEPASSNNDQILVNGNLFVDGELRFELGSFAPTPAGTTFQIAKAGARSGTFSKTSSPGLFEVSYTADSVLVTTLKPLGQTWSVIKCDVELQDFIPGSSQQFVDAQLLDSDENLVADFYNVQLDTDGALNLYAPIEGDYKLRIKASHWLSRMAGKVILDGNTVSVDRVVLVNGDVDGDNIVSILDYLALSAAYETTPTNSGWDARCDLDGDGEVSILDYIILSTNFDREGT